MICSTHINKRAFTKQDHDEAIKEQEISFPHITSSLEYVTRGKVRCSGKSSIESTSENMINTSI